MLEGALVKTASFGQYQIRDMTLEPGRWLRIADSTAPMFSPWFIKAFGLLVTMRFGALALMQNASNINKGFGYKDENVCEKEEAAEES